MNRSIYYFNPFTTSNKNSAVENLYYMHACSYSNSRLSDNVWLTIIVYKIFFSE